MNTGTPDSNPGARRNALRTGPHGPRGRGHAKLVSKGRPAGPHTATGLIGSRPAVWLAMAAMLAIMVALAMFQGAPPAEAAAGDATGIPGIVDQANPGDSLTTVRPDMTLLAVTTDIMDPDDLTSPGWTYQWKHEDTSGTVTDINGATSATYLVTESDIGKAFMVSVTFTDDATNTEGPLTSPRTQYVGPKGLIISNTGLQKLVYPDVGIALTSTTTKFAQGFNSSSSTEPEALDYIELTFNNLGDTTDVGDNITVTLNADSSGEPGATLCTLINPQTFSMTGAHRFYAPTATISTRCPQLAASSSYHVVIEMLSTYTDTVSVTHAFESEHLKDEGTAFGWTLADSAQMYSSSAWAANDDESAMLIDVRARLTEFELAELTETEVPFGWGLTPTGIAGGEKFRLLFLTDDESPTSTDINVYNEFVQAQAAGGHADIQQYASQFRVLGSTESVDATNNTETVIEQDPPVQIYWLSGQIITTSYDDFLADAWNNEGDPRTADGSSTSDRIVWTGSTSGFFEAVISRGYPHALGTASVCQRTAEG